MSLRQIKWEMFSLIAIGNFLGMLDATIVNLALYPMANSLGVSISHVQWVMISYTLVLTVFLPIWGKIGDIVPKNKLYALGFLLFAFGSFLNTTAQSFGVLLLYRCIEALGASIIISNASSIIASLFKGKDRGKALGLNGCMIALGGLLGPSLGGILIQTFNWHAIFAPAVPVALLGAYLSYKMLPSFVVPMEQENSHSLIDFGLFAIKPFTLGNLAVMLSYMAMFTNTILLPFYLQDILKFQPLTTALIILPYSIVLMITAPLSGRAAGKYGSRYLTLAGPVVTFLALSLFVLFDKDTPVFWIMILSGAMGLGNGLFQSPSNTAIISSVPKAQLGIASGILALSRNMGHILGVALTITLFAGFRDVFQNLGFAYDDSFLKAYRYTMAFGMVLAFLCMILSYFAYRDNKKDA